MIRTGPTVLLLTFARRGEAEIVRGALEALTQELPGARFTAVGTPASAPLLRSLAVDEIAIFREGRPAGLVMREVRARQPEYAAIIYSGPGTSGHLKLELVALGAGTRRIYRFVAGRPARSVARWALCGSIIGKLAQVGLRLAAGAVICGIAFCCVRSAQLLAGRPRAGRP